MITHHSFFIIAVFAGALLVGCSESPPDSPDANSSAANPSKSDGIVKIAVMANGTVFVNDDTVPLNSLSSKLDGISEIKEVWYHREAPEAAEPHENAMKAIALIADRKHPIAMYLDRDFTQRMNLGGP